ncbi:MAG TPA: long-chain fatty acid--CoA ligase [Myxococcales bacterium]|nr:long-chain fatty acid--CoA ligase [Myxococcales bacterium]
MKRTSTIHAFFETAAQEPDRVALRHRLSPGRWSAMTRAEYAREVRRIARALIALGVRPGERIALCGPNRPEWLLSDLGALAAGAIPAPYYPTLPAEQAAYVVEHSESVVAVVHDANQLAKLDAMRARLPRLRARVLMEGSAPGALSWTEFVARSNEIPDSAVDERLEGLESDALATLIYTSGTTGPPKAVMISHGNLLFAADVVREQLDIRPGDELVSYLPLSHIAEQMCSLHSPSVNGYCIACCEKLEELPEMLREVRPTLFVGVPRVWEKMQSRIEERLQQAAPRRRALIRWAQKLALARARGERPLLHAAADALVLRKLRAALGLDRARLLATAAAPIPRATLEFFESLGMPLYELYGQSECTGATTANTQEHRQVFSVGRPLPRTELRLADDGEILIRGPHVFLGYLKDAEATAAALTPDGWLQTGDVGRIDRDGFLHITDRKKDLLITSGGKNVSPQNIEGQLTRIPGVAHAVVVGDARKHLVALLALDRQAAVREAQACGAAAGTVEALCVDPRFIERIARGVDEVNRGLASYETIKKFRLLPVEFGIESGELTPTFKLRRKAVNQRFAREIEELFG